MELGTATHLARAGARRGVARHEVAGLGRLRRVALVAALVALIPAAFSYLGAVNGPSNSSLGIRTVEWLRDHGAAGLVAQVESIYYSLTAPAKGGPTLHALPRVGYGATRQNRDRPGALAAAEYRRRAWPRCSSPRCRARGSGGRPVRAWKPRRRCCSRPTVTSPNTRASSRAWRGSTPNARTSP